MRDSTSADDFCQRLAMNFLSDFNLEATYVARLDNDGRFTMVGSWGYPEDRRRPDDRPSLWEPMAMTETVRSGDIMVFDTWEAYVERYPHLKHRAGPGKAFVCVPFSKDGTRTGGLGIAFAEPLTDKPLDHSLLEILATAGDCMINRGWADNLFKHPIREAERTDASGAPLQLARPETLTVREIGILRMVAQGMTNASIARSLKYSESLIKKELIEIFKKLGVKNRKDAALAGATLGLLEPSGD